jgi:tetratricopeptide (TPR) repeat protein
MKLPLLCVALILAAQAVPAQERDAEKIFDMGRAFQKWGEESTSPAEAIQHFQRAIMQYAEVTRLQPNHCRAHALWARSLHALARHIPEPVLKRARLAEARERYATAARCPGAEWSVYHEWAAMLTFELENLADTPEQRRATLTEAAEIFQKALELARFSGDRAGIQRDLGVCLLLLGKDSTEPSRQRQHFKQAAECFESATRVEAQSRTARIYGLWGVALLELAKLNRDRLMMRQAIERLQTALQLQPGNPEASYNLTCAYAWLNQPEPALRHLKTALANDPTLRFHHAAQKDPDLQSLRHRPEYTELFAPKPPPPPDALSRPAISDR